MHLETCDSEEVVTGNVFALVYGTKNVTNCLKYINQKTHLQVRNPYKKLAVII